ncbi:SDR family NAD(P)-dependent oxidoreductase [Amycolatopsis sp. NPDC004169]|uniref:SDR family NAD(P)-dependent oxidoreductase n=1 Tax=Amycolatopsis sp. NPDC004169 TaxID=3154453 RepID=UPI0033BB39F7
MNNAGFAVHGGFAETPLEDSLGVLDLNCRAVVTLAHAFLAHARPGAALVNVSSTLGFTPKPGLGVHSATKAFVTSFSEALARAQRWSRAGRTPCSPRSPGCCPAGPRCPCSARPSRPRPTPRAA